ncbi:hypothetical protein JCM11641_000685 [Rhodosporidiobolus odoratus]
MVPRPAGYGPLPDAENLENKQLRLLTFTQDELFPQDLPIYPSASDLFDHLHPIVVPLTILRDLPSELLFRCPCHDCPFMVRAKPAYGGCLVDSEGCFLTHEHDEGEEEPRGCERPAGFAMDGINWDELEGAVEEPVDPAPDKKDKGKGKEKERSPPEEAPPPDGPSANKREHLEAQAGLPNAEGGMVEGEGNVVTVRRKPKHAGRAVVKTDGEGSIQAANPAPLPPLACVKQEEAEARAEAEAKAAAQEAEAAQRDLRDPGAKSPSPTPTAGKRRKLAHGSEPPPEPKQAVGAQMEVAQEDVKPIIEPFEAAKQPSPAPPQLPPAAADEQPVQAVGLAMAAEQPKSAAEKAANPLQQPLTPTPKHPTPAASPSASQSRYAAPLFRAGISSEAALFEYAALLGKEDFLSSLAEAEKVEGEFPPMVRRLVWQVVERKINAGSLTKAPRKRKASTTLFRSPCPSSFESESVVRVSATSDTFSHDERGDEEQEAEEAEEAEESETEAEEDEEPCPSRLESTIARTGTWTEEENAALLRALAKVPNIGHRTYPFGGQIPG